MNPQNMLGKKHKNFSTKIVNNVIFRKKGYWINLKGSQECCGCEFAASRSKLLQKNWDNKFQENLRDSSFHLQIKRSIFNCSYCPHFEDDFINLLKHVELTHLEKKDYKKSKGDLIKKHLKEIYHSIQILNREYSFRAKEICNLNLKNNYFERSSTNRNIQAKQLVVNSRELPVSDVDNYHKNGKTESNNNANSNINIHCTKIALKEKQNVNNIDNKFINIYCSKCAKQFTNKYILNQHEILCTGLKMTNYCLKCKREFHSQKISGSSTIISSESIEMCPECKADYMKNCLSDSTRTYSSICATPKIKDVSETSLHRYLKLTGHVEKTSPFPECKATFDTKKSQHKSSKNTYIDTFCVLCKKKFSTILGLEAHKQSGIHETMTYLCSICNSVFSKFEVLEQHKKSTRHKKINILCSVCHSTFNSKNDLDGHIKCTGHNKITSSSVLGEKYKRVNRVYTTGCVLCLVCRSVFSNKNILEQHIKDTGHDSSLHFVCSVCSASFETKDALDQHATIFDHKIKTDSNKTCQKELATEKDIEKHKESSVHNFKNENETHSCKPCQKEFAARRDLEQHMQSYRHNFKPKIRTYSCEPCQQKFVAKTDLEQNMESPVHNLEHKTEVYSCKPCLKEFVSKKDLKRHMKTSEHIMKRKNETYSCNSCQKEFVAEFDLKQHMESSVHNRDKNSLQHSSMFPTQHSLKYHINATKRKSEKFCVQFVYVQHLSHQMHTQHIKRTGH